jgi:3-hydroxyacyl-[acyl-carrier-protein] dehydratase
MWSAAMRFQLIDSILQQTPDRIVALKQVSLAEEYLADHFPAFPVLPGVLMVEAMVQAARAMLAPRRGGDQPPLVLGEVKALKFGNMVRPGESLKVEVTLTKQMHDGSFLCKGTGTVQRRGTSESLDNVAVSGRFIMRPMQH